jgi:hypothetical protein
VGDGQRVIAMGKLSQFSFAMIVLAISMVAVVAVVRLTGTTPSTQTTDGSITGFVVSAPGTVDTTFDGSRPVSWYASPYDPIVTSWQNGAEAAVTGEPYVIVEPGEQDSKVSVTLASRWLPIQQYVFSTAYYSTTQNGERRWLPAMSLESSASGSDWVVGTATFQIPLTTSTGAPENVAVLVCRSYPNLPGLRCGPVASNSPEIRWTLQSLTATEPDPCGSPEFHCKEGDPITCTPWNQAMVCTRTNEDTWCKRLESCSSRSLTCEDRKGCVAPLNSHVTCAPPTSNYSQGSCRWSWQGYCCNSTRVPNGHSNYYPNLNDCPVPGSVPYTNCMQCPFGMNMTGEPRVAEKGVLLDNAQCAGACSLDPTKMCSVVPIENAARIFPCSGAYKDVNGSFEDVNGKNCMRCTNPGEGCYECRAPFVRNGSACVCPPNLFYSQGTCVSCLQPCWEEDSLRCADHYDRNSSGTYQICKDGCWSKPQACPSGQCNYAYGQCTGPPCEQAAINETCGKTTSCNKTAICDGQRFFCRNVNFQGFSWHPEMSYNNDCPRIGYCSIAKCDATSYYCLNLSYWCLDFRANICLLSGWRTCPPGLQCADGSCGKGTCDENGQPTEACDASTDCDRVADCYGTKHWCRSFDGVNYAWVTADHPLAQCAEANCSARAYCGGKSFFCASDPNTPPATWRTWRECPAGCANGVCNTPVCGANGLPTAGCTASTSCDKTVACNGKNYTCRSPNDVDYSWVSTESPLVRCTKGDCSLSYCGGTMRSCASDPYNPPTGPMWRTCSAGCAAGVCTPPTCFKGLPTAVCDESTSCDKMVDCDGKRYGCRSFNIKNYSWVSTDDPKAQCSVGNCGNQAYCARKSFFCASDPYNTPQTPWATWRECPIGCDDGVCKRPTCGADNRPTASCDASVGCDESIPCGGKSYYCRSFDGKNYAWTSPDEPQAQCTAANCDTKTQCGGKTFYCAADPMTPPNTGKMWRECAVGCVDGACKIPTCSKGLPTASCGASVGCDQTVDCGISRFFCRSFDGQNYAWVDAKNPNSLCLVADCAKRMFCGGNDYYCAADPKAFPATLAAWRTCSAGCADGKCSIPECGTDELPTATCGRTTDCGETHVCSGKTYECRSFDNATYTWVSSGESLAKCSEANCGVQAYCGGTSLFCATDPNDPSFTGKAWRACPEGCLYGMCFKSTCNAKGLPTDKCDASVPCSDSVYCDNKPFYCRSFDGLTYDWVKPDDPRQSCIVASCSSKLFCGGREYFCSANPNDAPYIWQTWRECALGCYAGTCRVPASGGGGAQQCKRAGNFCLIMPDSGIES